MSKATILDWWLKFAQTDLNGIYKKTKLRLRSELEEHVNEYQDDPCGWRADPVPVSDLADYQAGALIVAQALLDPELPRPRGRVQHEEEMVELTSCEFVVCDFLSKGETATGLTLKALREAELTSREQISTCPVCRHVFVQHTLKRKRKYCSTICRNKANKEKKHGGNDTET